MSARQSTSCPAYCSGAMYPGVPITAPICVRFEESMRAMPKSAIFSRPLVMMIRLAGLMSRCQTPCSCA